MVDTGLPARRRRAVGIPPLPVVLRGIVGGPLWRDVVALALIVASIVGLAGLALYVRLWMPSLPNLLPLHYNSLGSVDLIGPRTELYKIPGIGGVVFIADLLLAGALHKRERLAALMLLSASVLVQIMLLVATMNIVRLAFGD